MIKPGFFANDELAELPMATRMLFAGLWTIADREGRLEDRPKRIKGELFRYDDLDIDVMLTQLADKGFIHRYEVGGLQCIEIVNFLKHQRPHNNEVASVLPPRCEGLPTKVESGSALNVDISLEPLTQNLDISLDTSSPSVSPVGEKTKRAKTAMTPLPEDLVGAIPAKVWLDIGSEQGLTDDQLRFETELMADRCRKKSERYADWVAAWRGWMRSPYRQTKSTSPPANIASNGFTLEQEREFRRNNPLLRVVEG